jgi:hypothetical protein
MRLLRAADGTARRRVERQAVAPKSHLRLLDDDPDASAEASWGFRAQALQLTRGSLLHLLGGRVLHRRSQ